MTTAAHLKALRDAVLDLNATKEDGFEGLLAALFETLTRQPFRLSASGLQIGEDAASFGDTRIGIEAKLYTGTVPRSELLNKITDVVGSGRPTDLWVLGATSGVASGTIQTLTDTCDQYGLGVLLLDWPLTGQTPGLAAALAMAPTVVADFLDLNIKDKAKAASARMALAALALTPAFVTSGEQIREAISSASFGLPLARDANKAWLTGALSDRRRAIALFGQPLAPLAAASVALKDRGHLVDAVRAAFSARPPSPITAILGDEGCGKTWLAAESWRGLAPPPVLLFASAADTPANASRAEDFEPWLINRLIDQTGEITSEVLRSRWRRRVTRWRKSNMAPASPRFVLLVDGLNQASRRSWPRWLDSMAELVESYGGGLALTSRAAYFRDHVGSAVLTPVTKITTPEWSEPELEELLKGAGADEPLSAEVRARLRNPRLLSIALELKSLGHITTLSQLTVGRLLFEHIRFAERDGVSVEPAHVFAQHLVEHAGQILDRVRSQQHDDRLVFSVDALKPLSELQALTGERFFQRLPETPSLYALTNDGLDLALGLAIIRQIQSALRNNRDAGEALRQIIEPIGALDLTATAMLAATSVAAVDENCTDELREALIVEYLALQNLDEASYPDFLTLLRAVPDAALAAHSRIVAAPRNVHHAEWLSEGVSQLMTIPSERQAVEKHIRRLLRTYSLSPALQHRSFSREEAAPSDKIADRGAELQARMALLSAPERALLEGMHRRDEFDPGALHRAAFDLLAGRPLAPFAEDLVACALSEAINSALSSPYNVFIDLIRFNKVDWREAETALRRAVARFATEDTSPSGQWAYVAVLRGLATFEDSLVEVRLVNDLTKDRQSLGGWRLVETYSTSDPCDPDAVEPPNLAATADRYAQVDVANLGQGTDHTAEDHFLDGATAAVARFKPETAVATRRRIAMQQLQRNDLALRIALARLRPDSVLFTQEHVAALRDIARHHSRPKPADGSRDPHWIVAQYALLLAFPHLTGGEQAEVLASLPPHGPLLLDLLDFIKPVPIETTTASLERALATGEETRILGALAVAAAQDGPLDDGARQLLPGLLSAERHGLRTYALSLIASRGGSDLLGLVARSDWRARGDAERRDLEAWYGSVVLVRAAEAGLLDIEEAIDRISPNTYGLALGSLGDQAAPLIARRLNEALVTLLHAELPTIDLYFSAEQSKDGPLGYSLNEPEAADSEEAFRRASQPIEQQQARNDAAWGQFRIFKDALTERGAELLLSEPNQRAIRACVTLSPSHGRDMADEIIRARPELRARARNFALVLAQELASHDGALSEALFSSVVDLNGRLTLTSGESKLRLDQLVAWRPDATEGWDTLRRRRLESADNDHDLALEVLSALIAGKGQFIESFAAECLADPQPVVVARGLTVLGFGLESAETTQRLVDASTGPGYLGQVAVKAREAYDRARWAKSWRHTMIRATDPSHYWRAGVLVAKLVDPRCDLWSDTVAPGSIAETFDPLFKAAFRRRMDRWAQKRKSSLFGLTLPTITFAELAGDQAGRP